MSKSDTNCLCSIFSLEGSLTAESEYSESNDQMVESSVAGEMRGTVAVVLSLREMPPSGKGSI